MVTIQALAYREEELGAAFCTVEFSSAALEKISEKRSGTKKIRDVSYLHAKPSKTNLFSSLDGTLYNLSVTMMNLLFPLRYKFMRWGEECLPYGLGVHDQRSRTIAKPILKIMLVLQTQFREECRFDCALE